MDKIESVTFLMLLFPFHENNFSFLLQLINLSQKNNTLTRMNHKVVITNPKYQLQRSNAAVQCQLQYVWFVCQIMDTGWVGLLAPDLDQILSVCTTMQNWLQTHPKHVLVLHCRVNFTDSSAHTDTDMFFNSIYALQVSV